MPFEKYYDEQRPIRGAACIHLRSKSMYVTGELKNPDHPDEAGSQYCWCNMTQHVIGPDQKTVELKSCINGRGCFRETY
jgi:hypothetical protein